MTGAAPLFARRLLVAAAAALAGAALPAACGSTAPAALLTRDQVQDPEVCQSCHPTQYAQWSGSMHAYASQDPVFRAMNKRGQRETNGALGDFCVKCHAPVAVQQNLTKDGLDLDSLPPPAQRGVTCYFCHSTVSADGVHDDPLSLAADGESLFGPFSDPLPGTPHKVSHSNLLDGLRAESAAACGSCHDIVNSHGAAIERTYQEWQATRFAVPPQGQTCAACHMSEQAGVPAATTGTHTLHDHSLAGVDQALTPFPNADAQKDAVQATIDPTLLPAVCWNPVAGAIEVDLDNAGAGHGFPSGASQDRRVWVEVTAFAGGQVIYQSGVPPAGQTVETAPDPDLWMIRDCLFGVDGKPVNMFWDAADYTSNQVPGAVTLVVTDPSSYTRSHVKNVYPGGGARLPATPDRITIAVRMKAIGDDVLGDLVASGDLDPSFLGQIPTLTPQSGTLEWTMDTATPVQGVDPPLYCVVKGNGTFRDSPNLAASHARCAR
ncbi:MAG TPA: multiheme c-type cytochrome [Polyangia bacterium]|nr:multiheme c-type cytochrome [Polyangia bacterium]